MKVMKRMQRMRRNVIWGCILWLFTIILCFSGTALASAPALTVKINIDGNSEVLAAYTKADLQKMPQVQQAFSSVDKMPSPVLVLAQGVSFTDWLKKAGIAQASLKKVTLATDGWSKSFDADFLFAQTRYYYPNMVSCWDNASKEQALFLEGAEAGKVAVTPILALASSETRFAANADWSQVSTADGIRFCFGQKSICDDVNSSYGKNISTIELYLATGTDAEAIKAAVREKVPPAVVIDETEENEPENTDEKGSGAAGLVSDTLTVKVGYFGGPYSVKKVFTLADLESMPQVQQAYTWIDRMPAVVMDSARGVTLTDILASAGIDVASVESFYFYCKDVKTSWYQALPKAYLLDGERYYYPNLPTHWDSDLQSSTLGASVGAQAVETIIAIEDDWQRFGETPNFENMVSDNRFRLVFGQTDTNTPNAYRSAKWIHCIEVMLGGTAPKGVYLDAQTLQLNVGSAVRLHATLEEADSHTDKRLLWSSDNPDAVTVDENGTVTVVGEGQAKITVTTVTGKKTAVCVVNGPEEDAVQQNPKNSITPNQQEEPLLSKDAKDAGLQPWRIYEMSADAVAMPAAETDKSMVLHAAVLAVFLFFVGVLKGYFYNKREVK